MARVSTALLGGSATAFGTGFAVRSRVAVAFLCTGLASLRTDLTGLARKATAVRDQECGRTTELRAVLGEIDAGDHPGHLGLVQAGVPAAVSSNGGVEAGLDAGGGLGYFGSVHGSSAVVAS